MIIEIQKNKKKQYFKYIPIINKHKDCNVHFHNTYGPAEYRADEYKSYIINNKLHNEVGYAFIDIKYGYNAYFLNGIFYSPHDWNIHIKNQKKKLG